MKKFIIWLAKVFKVDIVRVEYVTKIVEKQVSLDKTTKGDVTVKGNLIVEGTLKGENITCYKKEK